MSDFLKILLPLKHWNKGISLRQLKICELAPTSNPNIGDALETIPDLNRERDWQNVSSHQTRIGTYIGKKKRRLRIAKDGWKR